MRTRVAAGALLGALALSGCGVLGANDAAQASVEDVSESASVRVSAGTRFFDIDPSILVDDAGQPVATAENILADRVEGLSIRDTDPVDAEIFFVGDQFVVNPSTPGTTPDLDALAIALSNNDGAGTIDMPLAVIDAEVSNETATQFVDELNERLANGIDVRLESERATLPISVLGAATSVDWVDDDWELSIDFRGIADELNRLFAHLGTDGGQASFNIEPGETVDDPSTVVIVPGTPGSACCDDTSVARILAAINGTTEIASLRFGDVDGPRGVAWAENLGVDELVGSFTTEYTAGQTRNINIERIAELSQGMLIESGQTWSLNDRIGERTIDNGFAAAGTIVNGHLTDSVGGGISQFATTLFNAAFFAGLEFEDYQSHSIYFSRYPYGREATISWPAPEFEIFNPTPYAILIWPTTTANSVTVDLYSTKWVDAEQTGQVESPVQVACTRVDTERTRTFLDGTVDVDSVFAIYREEGIGCNGEPTVDPDAPPTTTTTTPPPAPPAAVPVSGPNQNPAEDGPAATAPTPRNAEDAEPEPVQNQPEGNDAPQRNNGPAGNDGERADDQQRDQRPTEDEGEAEPPPNNDQQPPEAEQGPPVDEQGPPADEQGPPADDQQPPADDAPAEQAPNDEDPPAEGAVDAGAPADEVSARDTQDDA